MKYRNPFLHTEDYSQLINDLMIFDLQDKGGYFLGVEVNFDLKGQNENSKPFKFFLQSGNLPQLSLEAIRKMRNKHFK